MKRAAQKKAEAVEKSKVKAKNLYTSYRVTGEHGMKGTVKA